MNPTALDKSGIQANTFKPKKHYFQKFTNETLFYIFYYMPKDSLQVFSAEELYRRKWKLHSENNVWFFKIELSNENSGKDYLSTKESKDEYNYFHPSEWKTQKYVFGYISPSKFISEGEIIKYLDNNGSGKTSK